MLPAQRSLVLFPGSLGDFLCFLPALRALSEGQQVDLLAHCEFADLVSPNVTVRSLECYEVSRLFVPGSAQEQRLRDFFSAYSSIFSWTGSGCHTFVQQLDAVCRGEARVYPFQPWDMRMHQADYYLACVGERWAESRTAEIPLKPDAIAWSEQYWRQHSLDRKQILALAPGSGAREKNWPESFFQAVADWWRQRTLGAVVVFLGPVEEEKGDYAGVNSGAVVARHLTLAQVAALLARSDLYLGNDSGVTHLAAALGVATIALFGPSDVRQWAPRGKRVTVVSRNVECSPCTAPLMKSCAHRMCLTTLDPTDVIEELERQASGIHLVDKRGGQGLD